MTNNQEFEPAVEDVNLSDNGYVQNHQAAEGYGQIEEEQTYGEQLEEFLRDTPDDVSVLPSNVRDMTASVQKAMSRDDIGQLGWSGKKIRDIYKQRFEQLEARGSSNLDGGRTALYEVATAIGIASAEMTRGFDAEPPSESLANTISHGFREEDPGKLAEPGFSTQQGTAQEVIEETVDWEYEAFDLDEEVDFTQAPESMEGMETAVTR